MALIPRFSDNDIKIMLEEGLEEEKSNLIKILRRIGIEAVNKMREQGSYTDRTSNLRNSTGYLISVDGEIVDSLFNNAYGEKYALEVLSEFNDQIVLLIVAGMNYASYVESRGYNVLASGELTVRAEVNKLINQFNNG